VTSLASDQHGVEVKRLIEGYGWWLTSFLVREMYIMPSELIDACAQGESNDVQSQLSYILACFKEIQLVLGVSKSAVSPEVKSRV